MSTNSNFNQLELRLAKEIQRDSLFTTLALGVSGFGFVVIYYFAQFGLLGVPAPQLLYLGILAIIFALSQIPIRSLSQDGSGFTAVVLSVLFVSIIAIPLVLIWEGVALLTAIIIVFTYSRIILSGMPGRYTLGLLAIKAAGVAGVYIADQNPVLLTSRLQTNTPAAIASLAFLIATAVLLVTVNVTTRIRQFHSIRNQLLTSFSIIVAIPTLLAIILTAVGAYVNNEAQTLNTLEAISSLKENQVSNVVDGFREDASRITSSNVFTGNVMAVLSPDQLDEAALTLVRSNMRQYLVNSIESQSKIYSEFLVLGIQGNVEVSTDENNEGKNFQSELFFREGQSDEYTGFSKYPFFGDANLIFSKPLSDANGIVRGVLVMRANSRLIKDVIENTPSFVEMESYLLDVNYFPLTKTRVITQTVRTQASESILTANGAGSGRGTYENYAGDIVLGYYKQFEPLKNTAFIAEVPREFVVGSSIRPLLSSSALAAIAILMAIAAVFISADSIASPISTLAGTVASFAEGKLAVRAQIERLDEIGALGKTYNQMADQLQDFIGQLEKRVADRTRELEGQSQRLLAAAEIAKEAASYTDPSKLLEEAGELIQNRFDFYHTGIFLIDEAGEFAVLAASPTEAGRQMLVNRHKLRVGEVGIVGRVSETGEPRITLDTDLDAFHFNNPLLPKTRSEMAIPIKSENRIIGVLDVQSDKPQAFAQEDVAIMTIFADQLGIAIERARLLQRVEANLAELERAYGRSSSEGWKALAQSGLLDNAGYRFDNIRIQPIATAPELGVQAMQSGQSIVQNDDDGDQSNQTSVAIPVKLRGQSIGVVTVKLKAGYNQGTINTIEQAIERLAASLESARLFEEARLRADREQAISQVTASISSSTDFDSILRTTVEEIGKSLGDSEVSIQILGDTGQE